MQQVAAGGGIGGGADGGGAALGDEVTTPFTGAGADVDDMVGAADGVFVVFDDYQGVALVAQLVQRVQQDLVVARVQAYGRLVEHIANALQVAAELRGQADALGFAAGQRGCATVQRQVAQAHFFQKRQPAMDFGQQVAGNVGIAAGELQRLHPQAHLGHAERRQIGDAN